MRRPQIPRGSLQLSVRTKSPFGHRQACFSERFPTTQLCTHVPPSPARDGRWEPHDVFARAGTQHRPQSLSAWVPQNRKVPGGPRGEGASSSNAQTRLCPGVPRCALQVGTDGSTGQAPRWRKSRGAESVGKSGRNRSLSDSFGLTPRTGDCFDSDLCIGPTTGRCRCFPAAGRRCTWGRSEIKGSPSRKEGDPLQVLG